MRLITCLAIPLFLFSAFNSIAQITIIGKVRDSLNNKIILYEPINNVFNYDIEDSAFTISLDSDNRFARVVDVNIPMQMIIVAGPVICPFFAFPKDTINIEINVDNWSPNQLNTKKTIEFHGRNKLGNELFHQAYFPGMGMTIDFDNDLKKGNYFGGLRRITQFDSILKMQTIRYDNLLREKAITRNFHRYVTKIILEFLLTHHLGDVYESKQYTTEEKIDYVGKMLDFYKIDPLDPIHYNNFYWRSISGARYRYLEMIKHKTVSLFADKNIIINNRSYFLNANLANWREAPVKIQESLWALSLISLKRLFPNSYDDRDVETYLAVFPNSPYKKVFQTTTLRLDTLDKKGFSFGRLYFANSSGDFENLVFDPL